MNSRGYLSVALTVVFAGCSLACSPLPVPSDYKKPDLARHAEKLIAAAEIISEVEVTKVNETWSKSPPLRKIQFKKLTAYKSEARDGHYFVADVGACDHLVEHYAVGEKRVAFLIRPTPKGPLRSSYFTADNYFSFTREQVEAEVRRQLTKKKK
jgi:hypothetical protein